MGLLEIKMPSPKKSIRRNKRKSLKKRSKIRSKRKSLRGGSSDLEAGYIFHPDDKDFVVTGNLLLNDPQSALRVRLDQLLQKDPEVNPQSVILELRSTLLKPDTGVKETIMHLNDLQDNADNIFVDNYMYDFKHWNGLLLSPWKDEVLKRKSKFAITNSRILRPTSNFRGTAYRNDTRAQKILDEEKQRRCQRAEIYGKVAFANYDKTKPLTQDQCRNANIQYRDRYNAILREVPECHTGKYGVELPECPQLTKLSERTNSLIGPTQRLSYDNYANVFDPKAREILQNEASRRENERLAALEAENKKLDLEAAKEQEGKIQIQEEIVRARKIIADKKAEEELAKKQAEEKAARDKTTTFLKNAALFRRFKKSKETYETYAPQIMSYLENYLKTIGDPNTTFSVQRNIQNDLNIEEVHTWFAYAVKNKDDPNDQKRQDLLDHILFNQKI